MRVPLSPLPDDWIDHACALNRSAQARCGSAPLQGLSLGVVCADIRHEAASLFRDAALGLGAQVTVLDPARLLAGDDASLDRVARLLGRLYDAIECQGLPAPLVKQLAQLLAVPVFDGVAAGAQCDADERQHRLRQVQAALMLALRGEGA